MAYGDPYGDIIVYGAIQKVGGTESPKTIGTLEAIRNLEIVYGGRFYISKDGKATWESRFHR